MRAWAVAVVLACAVPAQAQDAARPGVLVYAFSYERAQSNETEHAYGLNKMDPKGGGTMILQNINQHHLPPLGGGYDAPEKRSGTLHIQAVREQPDGGLVLTVSEPPLHSAPFACVTFSNTTVVCDPNANPGPEVFELVATLAKGFVDPARLDANNHWQLELDGSVATTADYRVVARDGTHLDIREDGTTVDNDAHNMTLIGAKIDYDAARALPTALDESTVTRVQRGAILITTTTYATFELQSPPP